MEKVPVKFGNKIVPHCQVCGSGEYMTNKDGNRNDYCGQCGTALDWEYMEDIDTDEVVNMGTYSEWIEKLKDQWIGKKVIFENKQYTVVDVDYNGALLIDKKARMTDTTAVGVSDIKTVQTLRKGVEHGKRELERKKRT